MKNKIFLKLTMVVLCLATTNVFAQVKSDFDKNTDFSKYKTYVFDGWQKNSDQKLNDFDKKRILEALKAEFDTRGLTLVDNNADAHIALYIVLDKKTSTTAYTNYMGGLGYGPRWGWGMGGMGMGTATTTYSDNDYIEGTLVVDMYDSSDKKLVWQGVLTTDVNEKPEKRDKTVPKKIKKLMKKFPVSPR